MVARIKDDENSEIPVIPIILQRGAIIQIVDSEHALFGGLFIVIHVAVNSTIYCILSPSECAGKFVFTKDQFAVVGSIVLTLKETG